jgi:NADH-quinone oxidoreductase subunit J
VTRGADLAVLPAGLWVPDLTAILPGVLFLGFAALSVGSAILAATATKIVHAAFGLLAAFFGVACLYGLLGADFLALAQVLVYVGGILVLLVFGILLTGRVRGALGLERAEKPGMGIALGGVLLFGLLVAIFGTNWGKFGAREPAQLAEPTPTTRDMGRALLDPERFLVPFELVSVLLLAALVGAAYLARRRREA